MTPDARLPQDWLEALRDELAGEFGEKVMGKQTLYRLVCEALAARSVPEGVMELEGALREIETACDALAATRSQATYLSMIDADHAEPQLERLDAARRAARAALAASPTGADNAQVAPAQRGWDRKDGVLYRDGVPISEAGAQVAPAEPAEGEAVIERCRQVVLSHIAGMSGLDGLLHMIADEIQGLAK